MLFRLIAAVAVWLSLTPAAQAEIRALVIGSDNYTHVQRLHRAVADAQAVRDRLIARGATPIYVENPTRLELNTAISRFINQVQPGDTTFVYHAGHGVQLDRDRADTLFFLPVDLDPSIMLQGDPHYALLSEAAQFSSIRRRLKARGAGLRVFILDNCRNNPLVQAGLGRTIGLDRGVGRVEAEGGEFVLFAAAPGELALDRLSLSDPNPNSVFTRSFLRHFQAGTALEDLANAVQEEVYQTSAEGGPFRQQPYYRDGVIGKACLEGANQCDAPPPPSQPADPCAAAPARAGYRCTVWNGFPSYERIAVAQPRPEPSPVAAPEPPRIGVFGPPVLRGDRTPPAPPTPQPGDVFRDFPAGPEMVVIPGGSYLMGSSEDEEGRQSDEGPQTRVTIGSFALGKYEVTFAEYDACAAAGACRQIKRGGDWSDGDQGWGRGSRPVITVNVEDAEKYIGWLNSQVDGSPYRLPSESEWEYAARAGTTTRYPWGGSFSKDQANGSGTGDRDRFGATSPAGSFPANGFGLHDMIGNVWEWTADCWNSSYNGRPVDGSAWRSGNCTSNIIRGGSSNDSPQLLRSAFRSWNGRVLRYHSLGFRVARTLP